jgi:poly(3-hydroxybutyrate) depolymerase
MSASNELQLIETSPLRAVLRLPAAPSTSPRPLLCFLHGHGEAAPMDIEAALTLHGPLHPQAPRDRLDRFIVLAPQLPIAGDIWHRHADDLLALVERVTTQHGSAHSPRYLCGFSFGGNGVFDLAMLQPEAWSALWSVDPTRPPDPAMTQPTWLSIGDRVRRREAEFFANLRSKPADDGLEADRVHLDQHQDHVESARLAFADSRIYDWLLSRER